MSPSALALLTQPRKPQHLHRSPLARHEQPACDLVAGRAHVEWRVQLQHLPSTALTGHLDARFGGMSVAVVSYVRFRKKLLSFEMASRRWGPGALYVGLCGTDEPLTWSCLSVCLLSRHTPNNNQQDGTPLLELVSKHVGSLW